MDQYTNPGINPGGGITYCMGCAAEFVGGGPGVVFCPTCADKMRKEQGEKETISEPMTSHNTNDPGEIDGGGFTKI